MITVKCAEKAITRLAQIRFFPGDEEVRAVLQEALGDICEDDEQVDWLARRTVDLVREWTGVHLLWQIYFSKYRPRDPRQRAIDIRTGSTDAFPEGVPCEIEESAGLLGSGQQRGLLGAPVDPVAQETLADATQASIMPPAPKRADFGPGATRVDTTLRRMFGELPEPQPRPPQVITAADVLAAQVARNLEVELAGRAKDVRTELEEKRKWTKPEEKPSTE